ncbi:MAG: pyruvate, phosphate dikinase [Desulfatibacillaceae bacterium]
MAGKKWVYLFKEVNEAEKYCGGDWETVRGLLGGKGANLADMTRLDIPVPPGFTVTTEACIAFLEAGGAMPDGMWEQELECLKQVEEDAGKNFGDPNDPLLVSCRSGAKFSMPGMMDTVLNIGLNDETAKGMVKLTNDERFVYDSYRRLIQMFGNVVMGIPDEVFEEEIERARFKARVENDAELSADVWKEMVKKFKVIFRRRTARDFPEDPYEQLRLGTEAVFKSWNGKRAVDYREAAGIDHNLGTAVSIVTMVFGNMGDDCATGVAMTRNGNTGENEVEGDYLINAQGEDVVAGTRMTKDISNLKREMPKAYGELMDIAQKLERHYREMQDMEFTIERGKLWMLQTRDGKRTAQAAVRIAVDMVEDGLITQEEAVWRVTPAQVDFFLHPQFDRQARRDARGNGTLVATGLNVSPGAAVGRVALDADLAQMWAKQEHKRTIMVRQETRPDDVHGMLAADGILTTRGGRTSHAALVARQFGKPAVVGVSSIQIDMGKRRMIVGDTVIHEGDYVSIDGNTGEVFVGELPTTPPDIEDPWLMKLLKWSDEFRTLGVWTNADTPEDAQRALDYGAEGIGLCRTEHMFLKAERLKFVQKMIMTDLPVERQEALDALLPFQKDDFYALFRVMDKKTVIIRLLDPPLHEFLPNHIDLMHELSDLKIRIQHARDLSEINDLLEQVRRKEAILKRVESLLETNPMLGLRGVRLGMQYPEVTVMQVKAIFEAACEVAAEGVTVQPEIMIPLTCHENEIKFQREILETEAKKVMERRGMDINYKFGTMIELPRAAITAGDIAKHAAFFSFGTNDLTQTTFGISRDDAEAAFLIEYMETGILPFNPFDTLDQEGVGELMRWAVTRGRETRPDLECGICGEHGGDPATVQFCHNLGLNYVSCSPFRVPIARIAAAHASLRDKWTRKEE